MTANVAAAIKTHAVAARPVRQDDVSAHLTSKAVQVQLQELVALRQQHLCQIELEEVQLFAFDAFHQVERLTTIDQVQLKREEATLHPTSVDIGKECIAAITTSEVVAALFPNVQVNDCVRPILINLPKLVRDLNLFFL